MVNVERLCLHYECNKSDCSEASVPFAPLSPHESMPTVPAKSTILALYRSLLRQARLLPHEYLRYLTAPTPLCSSLIYDRQFVRLKVSTDIRSALDETRKYRQRQATFKRLRKVTNFDSGQCYF